MLSYRPIFFKKNNVLSILTDWMQRGKTKRIEKRQEACLFSLSTQLATTMLQLNTFFTFFVFPALSAQTKDPIFFVLSSGWLRIVCGSVGGVCINNYSFFLLSIPPHCRRYPPFCCTERFSCLLSLSLSLFLNASIQRAGIVRWSGSVKDQ